MNIIIKAILMYKETSTAISNCVILYKNIFSVYLRTEPEKVYERIMARQRPEESAIQLVCS